MRGLFPHPSHRCLRILRGVAENAVGSLILVAATLVYHGVARLDTAEILAIGAGLGLLTLVVALWSYVGLAE
jgi:hypothetical protein